MKKITIILAIICLVLLVNSIFNFINSRNLYGIQKVCIAEKCSESVTGDAWATTFCKPNEDKTDIICDFEFQEQRYKIPLSKLNTSTLKSCIAKECAVEVYVKGKNVKEAIKK